MNFFFHIEIKGATSLILCYTNIIGAFNNANKNWRLILQIKLDRKNA